MYIQFGGTRRLTTRTRTESFGEGRKEGDVRTGARGKDSGVIRVLFGNVGRFNLIEQVKFN